MTPGEVRRIEYSGSVHDEAEIEAVVSVLRGGPTALRIGQHVRGFEQGVADLFGKARGIMVNSGSSALYLAVELLGLEPGDEVLTSPLTFSTDIAPLVRSGLVPVFVDVERDTYNLDVDRRRGHDRSRGRRRSWRRTSSATPRTGTACGRSPTATACR